MGTYHSAKQEWDIESADGTALRVVTTRDSERAAILLVHGLGQAKESFTQYSSMLLTPFTLVGFDQRGHGRSGKPRSPNAYAGVRYAQDIEAVISTLELRNVVLVAWSLGGYAVTKFLEYYGTNRVQGVVFVGAAPEVSTERFRKYTDPALLASVANFTSSDVMVRQAALETFVSMLTYMVPLSWDYYAMLGINMSVPSFVLERFFSRPPEDSLAPLQALKARRVPVLIIQGEHDLIVPSNGFSPFIQEATGGRLIHYPCGHMPFREMSTRFDKDLADFMGECSK